MCEFFRVKESGPKSAAGSYHHVNFVKAVSLGGMRVVE